MSGSYLATLKKFSQTFKDKSSGFLAAVDKIIDSIHTIIMRSLEKIYKFFVLYTIN